MDVNLIYQKTGYSFQISKFTPLSFIYEVSCKVFRLPLENIKLFFKDQFVPNDHSYASDYFKKFPVIINIMEIKKSNLINNEKPKGNEEKIFNETLSEKAKQKKKNFIKCQICDRKNSIFYCRNCNQFFCFECNLRYPEHFGHKKISLESGDLLLCFEDYKNSVIELLNELNNAYRFSSENLYTEKKRGELFDYLISTLKELDKKTQSLNIMGTSYKCNNEVLNNFSKELREIEAPKYKEETVNSFGLVNEKELEIHNYVSFVNLQILKSKFNKKMTIFFTEAKKIFNDLMSEINNKLHDSLYLKQKDYNDLIAYNKEKYKENDDSSESSSSNSSKKSLNKSSSEISSIKKNNKENNDKENNDNNNNDNNKKTDDNQVDDNQNEEFLRIKNNIINKRLNDKYKSTNNIQDKINLNTIINRQMRKYNSRITYIDSKNANSNSHRSYHNNNNIKINLNKNNEELVSLKEDTIPNNEMTIEENLTLPKIKVISPSYSTIHKKNDEKNLFSLKEKDSNFINFNNINKSVVKQSIHNILKNSSTKIISPSHRKSHFNNMKLIEKVNTNTIEVDKQKDIIIMQRDNKVKTNNNAKKINEEINNMNDDYNNKNINNNNILNNYNENVSKKTLSSLKLKSVNMIHENNHKKNNEEKKNHCITLSNDSVTKSLDKIAMNKIIKNLKKMKPNYKIKLFDSYKSKENGEENIEDKDINSPSNNPVVIALKKRRSTKTKYFKK